MPLKTTEVNGKTYAEVMDGKAVWVEDDGSEVPMDIGHTRAKISQLNAEAKGHREAKEAAERQLKAFAGIDDPDVARKAIETMKNIDSGQLFAAGKVEEIKTQAQRAAEAQVAATSKQYAEQLKALEDERNKLKSGWEGEKLSNTFGQSRFIREKGAVPPDVFQAMFGPRFKFEDGKLIGHDASGNAIFSRSKVGEIADPDEALEIMVGSYANRDSILKGTGSTGSGASGSRGGYGGKNTLTRADYDRMNPGERAQIMSKPDRPQIVD